MGDDDWIWHPPKLMGKQELTKQIAAKTGLTQKEAAKALEATLGSIRESLEEGKEVRLVGFGSFKTHTSAPRKGVNPRNRTPMTIPEKQRVRFSPGKELSDAVIKK